MKTIYAVLDDKNRLEYWDNAPIENSVEVEIDETHPIIAEGKVNFRYENGEWIEDNSVYEEWLAEIEAKKAAPKLEDVLMDLDFRFTMLELDVGGGTPQ